MIKKLIVFFVFIIISPFLHAQNVATVQTATDAEEIFKNIRCIVCKSQSIADSNADFAVQVRNVINEKLSIGNSRAEIEQYLVERYGDSILFSTPFAPKTYILWFMPFIVLGLISYFLFK